MIPNSRRFRILSLQVAKRRRDFLRNGGTKLFYPPLGQIWSPTNSELAYSEAFIVLFVAELETYIEGTVETALELFELSLGKSGLSQCKGATPYMDKIVEKRQQLVKNNNANWTKVDHFFEFIGIGKSKFPNDFWDDVELVVRERGSIVHKSLGLRTISDPRLVLRKSELVLQKLKIFDRDFVFWVSVRREELNRLDAIELRFQPGIGSISTGYPA